MLHDKIRRIRGNTKLYSFYFHDSVAFDPLLIQSFHVRAFYEKCGILCSTLWHLVSRWEQNLNKWETSTLLFVKSKPLKFGVRFFAVVGCSTIYNHFYWDKLSGNNTKRHPAIAYPPIFWSPLSNCHKNLLMSIVLHSSLSGLWCLPISHQTIIYK